MPYNLRPTSFVGEHLDNELARRGAHTSGSTARKQERLRRFRFNVRGDPEVACLYNPQPLPPRRLPPSPQRRVRTAPAPAPAVAPTHTYNTRARASAQSMVGVRSLLRDYIGY